MTLYYIYITKYNICDRNWHADVRLSRNNVSPIVMAAGKVGCRRPGGNDGASVNVVVVVVMCFHGNVGFFQRHSC